VEVTAKTSINSPRLSLSAPGPIHERRNEDGHSKGTYGRPAQRVAEPSGTIFGATLIIATRRGARSPADCAVNQLSDEVRMTVVARVLLDHVDVDPSERAALSVTQARVAQSVTAGCFTAGRALCLPDSQVLGPDSVV